MFYFESRSFYAEVSVILSKWTSFYSKVLAWVLIRERCPVRPLWGVGRCCAHKVCCKKLVGRRIRMCDVMQVFAKLSWHRKFIPSSPILNPAPSLDPESVRRLEPALCGASGSTSSRP